jgi:hypothetical protein
MTSPGPDIKQEQFMQHQEYDAYSLHQLFEPIDGNTQEIVSAGRFMRTQRDEAGEISVLLDRFPGTEDASCCFVRLRREETRTISFIAQGAYLLEASSSGGWLLKAVDAGSPSYWIPQAPMLRTLDDHGHITAERSASVVGLRASTTEMVVEIQLPANWCLDWHAGALSPMNRFSRRVAAPNQPRKGHYFLWGSKVNFQLPPMSTVPPAWPLHE